ncbi:bifunctional diaminohydroxyphosphoribosylaminopyrimidine deaminase/5-amino-6-(5-phosphoribosylamino)uracil reductase RibD [Enterovirga rhinocerotis]
MGLAIALGRRNNGRTWPNPSVGAVLVDPATNRILAEAATQPGGRPHAEAVAIGQAGDLARGATLYVSLEPCAHHGRTPPCADAIVAAGIGRVVVSMDDPDPRVAGRGHARIAAAGIALTRGVMVDEALRAHRGHFTRIREGRPAVTLKLARTSDGYAARLPGEDRLMISGEGAGHAVHLVRAHADAILVGVDTILADDPRLDVRLPGLADRSPLRVVFDTQLRLPLSSRLVATAGTLRTWVVCGEDADQAAERVLVAEGLDVIRSPLDSGGRLDLRAAMALLGARGLTRVFSEGGPTLADAMARDGLIDDLYIGTASVPLGQPGRPAIGPNLRSSLDRDFRFVESWRIEQDLVEHFERRPCSPAL